jgi:hypothetical protein
LDVLPVWDQAGATRFHISTISEILVEPSRYEPPVATRNLPVLSGWTVDVCDGKLINYLIYINKKFSIWRGKCQQTP